MKRLFRSSPLFLIPLVGAAASTSAQTNLLLNGSFEVHNGFGGQPGFSYKDTSLGFEGFDSDLDDDGQRNFSYRQDFALFAGGSQFDNVFPAGGSPDDPVLIGDQSAFMLGNFFNGLSESTHLFQQVDAAPGDDFIATIFAYSDTTRTRDDGFPDTIFNAGFQGGPTNNFVLGYLGFYDQIGGLISEQVETIFDPMTQDASVVQDVWKETSFAATAPSNTAFARVQVFFFQPGTAGGVIFMDDWSLVNTSAGAPLVADFDFDGQVTTTDLDLITMTVGGGILPDSERWDVDGSGQIDAGDIAFVQALLGGVVTGDYDNSGQVEQGDLDIVLQNWGTGTFTGDQSTLVGGGPFDGTVDQNELDGVLQNWGSTGSPRFDGVALPEPLAAFTLAAGLALIKPRPSRLN